MIIPTVPTAAFCYLVPGSGITADQRQEMYFALLRECPLSEQDAERILRRVRGQIKYQERKHGHLPILAEPSTDPPEPENGPMMKALDLLPAEDQHLVRQHVIDGHSLRDIAKDAGVNEKTIRKRYKRAKAKLKALVTYGPQ